LLSCVGRSQRGIELKAESKKEKTESKNAISSADCTCELTHTKTKTKIALKKLKTSREFRQLSQIEVGTAGTGTGTETGTGTAGTGRSSDCLLETGPQPGPAMRMDLSCQSCQCCRLSAAWRPLSPLRACLPLQMDELSVCCCLSRGCFLFSQAP